ncbi:MAG: FMN-dependent NADH-azoreductase [Wenzhouxiangella sp.]
MKTLLVIKSSLFEGAGQSSQLADAFAQRWSDSHAGGRVVTRDLAGEPLPHLGADEVSGWQLADDQRSPAQQAAIAVSDELIAELREADAVVLALPMYNFTVPSTFKAWMDRVARAGVTFRYTENGPQGLLDPKPLFVFCARGGQYSGTANDTQTRLIEMFFGMLGFKDIHFTYAEGLAYGEEAAAAALEQAHARIAALPLAA